MGLSALDNVLIPTGPLFGSKGSRVCCEEFPSSASLVVFSPSNFFMDGVGLGVAVWFLTRV